MYVVLCFLMFLVQLHRSREYQLSGNLENSFSKFLAWYLKFNKKVSEIVCNKSKSTPYSTYVYNGLAVGRKIFVWGYVYSVSSGFSISLQSSNPISRYSSLSYNSSQIFLYFAQRYSYDPSPYTYIASRVNNTWSNEMKFTNFTNIKGSFMNFLFEIEQNEVKVTQTTTKTTTKEHLNWSKRKINNKKFFVVVHFRFFKIGYLSIRTKAPTILRMETI